MLSAVSVPGFDHLEGERLELEMARVEGFGQRVRVSDLTEPGVVVAVAVGDVDRREPPVVQVDLNLASPDA
jgi:hypothetical protein